LEDSRKRSVAMAYAAFHEKDFVRVVELLEPVAELLSPAEQKKLEYARRHIPL
jgi:hypothetical protein